MAATALVCHVAMVWPRVALPASPGAQLLLCGALWVLGLAISLPNWLFQWVTVLEQVAGTPETLGLPPVAWPASCGLACLEQPVTLHCWEPWSFCPACWAWAALSAMWAGTYALGPWASSPPPPLGTLLCTGLCGCHGPPTSHITGFCGLCTLLAYSNRVVSPVLCFCLYHPFRAGLRAVF